MLELMSLLYSRKSVGPRIGLEELQHELYILVKTSHPEPPEVVYYQEKKKQGQISDLKFISKALDMSSATTRVAPDLLKVLTILPDTTVRRSAVDLEDLKPQWISEKRPHFSRLSTNLGYQQSFSKTLLITETRLTWQSYTNIRKLHIKELHKY